MDRSRRDLWLERKKLQWKLKLGFKLSRQELSRAKEIEKLVKLLQLLRTGRIVNEEESFLRKYAGKIVCDLVLEIINSKNDPMDAEEIASDLLNVGDNLLKSAGYLVMIEKVMGEKVSPMKFIRDLISVCCDKPEGLRRTIVRLLSRDNRFIRVERDLFVLRNWSPNKLFQEYVRLASEYRLTSPKKKRRFVREAIKLLETGKADFPNKKALIETLKRM